MLACLLLLSIIVPHLVVHIAQANLDAMDVAGEQQNGIDHDMKKMRCVSWFTPIDILRIMTAVWAGCIANFRNAFFERTAYL